MKITKISMRLTGAVACVTAFLIGATPMTAFAHTGPEAECICESKCSEDCINEECPVCKEDYTLCQGEEVAEDTEEKTEEPIQTQQVTSENEDQQKDENNTVEGKNQQDENNKVEESQQDGQSGVESENADQEKKTGKEVKKEDGKKTEKEIKSKPKSKGFNFGKR